MCSAVISVHALVLLSITDSITRQKLNSSQKVVPGIGFLVGHRNETEIKAVDAFEAAQAEGFDSDKVDISFAFQKLALFKSTHGEDIEIIGVYASVSNPEPDQLLALAKSFEEFNIIDKSSKFVFLIYDSNSSAELPISAYLAGSESLDHIEIKLDSDDAERVAVQDVYTYADSNTSGQSALKSRLTAERNAVAMLINRLESIQQYIDGVLEKKFEPETAIIRDFDSLVKSIKLKRSMTRVKDAANEENENVITAVLSLQSQVQQLSNTYVDDLSTARSLITMTSERGAYPNDVSNRRKRRVAPKDS